MAEMTIGQALETAAGFLRAGDLAAAESIYQQVFALHPNNATVHHLAGIAHAQVRRFDEAIRLISRAIQLEPSNADFHANLGTVFYELGWFDRAIDTYHDALGFAPAKLEIHHNLGNALRRAGRCAEAVASYRNALGLRPDYFEALLQLGIAHFEMGQWADAADAFGKAASLRPQSPDADHNLGKAMHKLNRFDEAIASLTIALNLLPESHEIALDLGNALREAGLAREAADVYRRAIAIKPDFADAHYGLSWALLVQGDFRDGFIEYEWRHRLAEAAGAVPVEDLPWWDGSALNGQRILIQAEQGFGDTIFAMRYSPRVAALGGKVVVRAPAPLVKLLRRQPGIDCVIENGKPAPNAQLQYMMMSVPKHFVVCPEEIALFAAPYLSADAELVEAWRRRLGGPAERKRVGVVWAGRPTPAGRSIPFGVLSNLLESPGIEFHSLQKGGLATEVRGSLVKDWDAEIRDFDDTAALIANLDLVITIDTAVAHLAGSMGKPVWVMLQYAADWRWFRDRSDSPWYPSMRLFRQSTPGDWAGVVESVAHALKSHFA